MSLILRQLLRDPLVTRPITRALRRYDDDWIMNDWVPRKRRALAPSWDNSWSLADRIERDMMANAMNTMQEMVNDLEELVEKTSMEVDNLSPRRSRNNETIVRRTESGGLQLALNVEGFKPEELKIKLVDDNLVVEALSESSGEDSYQRSQFKRWFKLPEDCKLEDIKSKLTSDKKLLIDLPTNKPIEMSEARSIPIETETATPTAGKTPHLEADNSNGATTDEAGRKKSAT